MFKRLRKKWRIWSKGRRKEIKHTPALKTYLTKNALVGMSDAFNESYATTASLPQYIMQTAPDQARLLGVLASAVAAKRVLEIGTFRGFGTLALAMAIGPEGKIVTCEKDPTIAAQAKVLWEKAGVQDQIDLKMGIALETIATLDGMFDFVFIDADKHGYEAYLNACLPLVREGGMLVFDNTLWAGRVADASSDDPIARSLATFNANILKRFGSQAALLPAWDGVTIVIKK